MPKMQMLAAFVNLGGDRDNVVYRGPDNPISLPEMFVLRAVHGGDDHVHGVAIVSVQNVDQTAEHERLTRLYGRIVNDIFPNLAGRPNMPLEDDSLPTLDDVLAANAAAAEVLAQRRAAADASTTPAPALPPAPAPEPIPAPAPTPAPAQEPVQFTGFPDLTADTAPTDATKKK
jgi:hypothetical protein